MLEQGGLTPGGLNFDCKVRRESIALEDMFISHIGIKTMAVYLLIIDIIAACC